MLFYSILLSFTVAIGGFIGMTFLIRKEVWGWSEILIGMGFFANLVYLGVITLFFKFHLELLFKNSSTIESLEKKRNPNATHNVKCLRSLI